MHELKGLVTMYPENGFHANSYVIRSSAGLSIIDPSLSPNQLSGGDRDRLHMLFATHGHIDHTSAAAAWLKEKPQAPYYMHEGDAELSDDPQKNVSALFGRPLKTAKPSHYLKEDEPVDIGDGLIISALHTPGHTQGSVCLLMEKRLSNGLRKPLCLFTGDTFFLNSVGRCDFIGGSDADMQKSLRKILNFGRNYAFPSDLPIFFGHGRAGCWSETLQLNPWLQNLKNS